VGNRLSLLPQQPLIQLEGRLGKIPAMLPARPMGNPVIRSQTAVHPPKVLEPRGNQLLVLKKIFHVPALPTSLFPD